MNDDVVDVNGHTNSGYGSRNMAAWVDTNKPNNFKLAMIAKNHHKKSHKKSHKH